MKRLVRGFTLLEVLFALLLLGLLLALVGTALLGGNRALERGARYAQRLDEVRASQNFLRRSVQQILPIAFQSTADKSDLMFDGQPQRLRYVAVLPEPLGGGIQLHTLQLIQNGPDAQSLQVRFDRIDPNGLHPWGEPQILLHDVRNLHFRYRGKDPEGHATQWLDQWPWPGRLPQQIRIDLDLLGPIAWVAQVASLQLELSGSGGDQ